MNGQTHLLKLYVKRPGTIENVVNPVLNDLEDVMESGEEASAELLQRCHSVIAWLGMYAVQLHPALTSAGKAGVDISKGFVLENDEGIIEEVAA